MPSGIYCLETTWDDATEGTSVEPVLRLLREVEYYAVPFVHRRVATKPELEHHLRQWPQKKFAKFPMLYLAFHGEPGKFWVDDSALDLQWLAQALRGKCAGRIVYFGSCATLDIHGRRLKTFLDETGAVAVAGYCADVEWLESAAFELLTLGELGSLDRIDRGSVRRAFEKIDSRYRDIKKSVDFRWRINDRTVRPAANTARQEKVTSPSPSYAIGAIVQVQYEEQIWEPCRIEGYEVRRGRVWYEVYFPQDKSVADVAQEEVRGLSAFKMAVSG